MTKLKDLKARFMEDPEFREEYARVDEEYALIEALIIRENRQEETQGAKQSLESCRQGRTNPGETRRPRGGQDYKPL